MPRGSDLVFVGDVHLDRDDPDLPPFLAYLDALGRSAGRIVFMGDLFNLWLGTAELEQDHHRAVLERLVALRAAGVELHYLEGNRDYRVEREHLGRTFDAVSDLGIHERWGGRRFWAAHGDRVNTRDAQYRLWRRLSRSAPVWGLFSALPRGRRFAVAESIEKRLRATNAGMKRAFPEAIVRAYAEPHLADGDAAVVLGHFHVERDLPAGPAGAGRIFVLPAWKDSRRHLKVDGSGAIRWESA